MIKLTKIRCVDYCKNHILQERAKNSSVFRGHCFLSRQVRIIWQLFLYAECSFELRVETLYHMLHP